MVKEVNSFSSFNSLGKEGLKGMTPLDIDVKIMCLLHVVRELREIKRYAHCDQLRKETDNMTREIVKQIEDFRKML